jgi:YVTN family beta-propeller protein
MLEMSHDAKILFVASADSKTITWLELPGGSMVRRIAVPSEPSGMSLSGDGTKLFVACAAPRSVVQILDVESGKLQAEIAAGHTAMAPVLSSDGNRLYVCNRFDNDVSVIDVPSGRELARVAVEREPVSAALTPDDALLFVANHLPAAATDEPFRGNVSPVVTVIDTRTRETTAVALRHGAHSLRDICVSPDGRHALVTHLLANFEMVPFRVDTGWINVNVVSIIDIQNRSVVSSIGLDDYYRGAGNPHDVVFSEDGQWVCVTVAGTHELCVIESSDFFGEFVHRNMQPMMGVWPIYPSLGDSLWQRISLPGRGPAGMAVADSRVYVAQYFSDSVAVVNLSPQGGRFARTIPLGPEPELTVERKGEMLFHDATLCYQNWQSCASCHPDGRVDALNWDLENDGQGNPKNTKSMLVAHATPPAMARGVRASAEVAVRAGFTHILFSPREEEESAAIDAYLKSLSPVPSPHLVGGQLSPAATRGKELFFSRQIGCHRCHPPPLFTDKKMHLMKDIDGDRRTQPLDTPTLLEVWRTAPYPHHGRYTTIKALLAEGRHGLWHLPHDQPSDDQLNDLAEYVLSL